MSCFFFILFCFLKGWRIWTTGQFSSPRDANGNSIVALWARRKTSSSHCSQVSSLQAAWFSECCYSDCLKQKGVRHSSKSYFCRCFLSKGKNNRLSRTNPFISELLCSITCSRSWSTLTYTLIFYFSFFLSVLRCPR